MLWCAFLIPLLAGVLLTAWLWRYSQQQQSEHLHKEFKFATEQVINNIYSRIDGYEIAMRGVRGYFTGSENVTVAEFRQYIQDLNIDKEKSGIQGVGVVEIVPHSQKNQFISRLRKSQLKDYRVWPEGDRDLYVPITRMEPMTGSNLIAMGFDVFTVPEARLAMEKSRDLNIVTITPPITLVQDADKPGTFAFVMYLPIYAKNQPLDSIMARRAAIQSWVDVPFRMKDLMGGLSGEFTGDIILEIYDGLTTSDQSRMYLSDNGLIKANLSKAAVTINRRLDIGGRTWTLLTKTTPSFIARVSNPNQSGWILFAGSILSLMLAWITLLQVSGRQKAQSRYKRLFAQAGEGVLILNREHRVLDSNHSAMQMFGYTSAEFSHLYFWHLLEKPNSEHLNGVLNDLSDSPNSLQEYACVAKDGLKFSAELSFSKLDADSYFVIIRDLTERKQAEQRIKRLNQLYLALSETSQAIVRMDNENELLLLVCKCAVEFGGMKMAWIGQVDEAFQHIHAAAVYAGDQVFLEILSDSSEINQLDNDGPPNHALAENRPIIINNLLDQALETPWHQQAKTFGWGSVASFPIQRNKKPFAVLTVYHDLTNVFDSEITGLLIEMSADIGFALDNFDREHQRLQSQNQLAESEKMLSTVLNNVGANIYLKDINGHYLFANKQIMHLWNLKSDEILGSGDERFFDADTVNSFRESDRKVLVEGEVFEHEETIKYEKNGEIKTYWTVKMPLRRQDGSIYGLCGISTDITQQKRAEADLRIAAISFESQVGMVITDADKVTLKVNQAYSRISQYDADEVIGHSPLLISTGRHDEGFYTQIWSDVALTGGWEGEVWNQRKNGEAYPQYLIITAVKDDNQHITNYVASITDISESKAAAMKIEHLAFFDLLTQLPNRRLLLDRLNRALTISQRSGLVGALLYLDLDHFKTINDSRGHSIGDLLLKQVAERLIECVRAEDTVARLGGDEYVIMLEGLSPEPLEAAKQTELVAQKIHNAMSKIFQLGTHQANVTASIGLVLFSGQKQTADELLGQADIAMYHAKKAGRHAFRFFDPAMQTAINSRVSLEEELRKALAMQHFQLHYQVQVNHLGNAIGAEALIRWQHPERGLISPFYFIPIAEETGLILPIGQWVLNQACKQLKLWERGEATKHLSLSINVSARQFHQDDFVEQVKSAVELHQIKPSCLRLELTESMLVDNVEAIISSMNALKKVGVSFELDDFGTGYSSLQYLKRLPLHQLKIDQSFVRDIKNDKSDKAIVRTIVKMAQGLGLEVIAEGVETEEQLQQLRKIGCLCYQGYLFSKPLPIDAFEHLLENQPTFKQL
jgi:diguanylate cyclase (GGDEF)-like protein/PAS domain S-box-containing protein